MPRAGISLGSNLGDRRGNIAAAIRRLREIATPHEPFLEASILETAPVDCPPDSPSFLNTVVEIDFDGDAFALLKLTRRIEQDLGREAVRERNAPRTVDLDLLYFGDEIIETPDLTLPHPRMREREFVMKPLGEIRPDLAMR